MTARKLRSAILGSAIALMAAPTMAQQPAAPAAAAQPSGTIVPGLCIYASGRAIGSSKVGTYVMKRLEQIAGQADGEVAGIRTKLQSDDQALSGQIQSAAIPQAQAEQKMLELRQRAQGLQELIQLRQREVDATQQKALERIANETLPLLETTMRERNCSVVLEQQGTIYYAPQMDLTAAVVVKLDAKLQEFPFDRERLDQPQAATGVQAPAGRAGPPAPARSGAAAPAAPAAGRGGRGN